jgi:hypothetical protein
MKVLDLQCSQAHQFEGWFGSEHDFQSQLSRGLVECPLCGEIQITKRLSAPRLNLLSSKTSRTEGLSLAQPKVSNGAPDQNPNSGEVAPGVAPVEVSHQVALSNDAHALEVQQQIQANWLKVVQQVIANTDDVGPQFADEARKMHYGETQERNIRGQVSVEESMELLDEGIPVMPLMIPAALKGSVH